MQRAGRQALFGTLDLTRTRTSYTQLEESPSFGNSYDALLGNLGHYLGYSRDLPRIVPEINPALTAQVHDEAVNREPGLVDKSAHHGLGLSS